MAATTKKTAAKRTTAKKAVPPTARKPQDRRPSKADDGILRAHVRGRDWEVPRDAMDDFELLDDLNALDHGEANRMPGVLRRLVGDQWGDVMEVLRDPTTGRVSIETGTEFVADLVEALNPNSSGS